MLRHCSKSEVWQWHTLARPNINVFFSYYVLGLILISIVYTLLEKGAQISIDYIDYC